MDVVLTMIDTAGIQDYIFGSNRLRENTGASYLVNQATREWVYEELNKLGTHNIRDLKKGVVDRDKKIEQQALAAELVYAGGGNTLILFRSPDEARVFAQSLSRRVLEDAPGLELVITHSDPFVWDPEGSDLYAIREDNVQSHIVQLRDVRLAQKKRTRQATSTALLGLGVTAECDSTGLVATRSSRGLEPEGRLVSREIIAKLEANVPATWRLQNLFAESDVDPDGRIAFSDELDHLGRRGGEESYLAVVHLDGNDMGGLIAECEEGAKDNRDYINRVRDFSENVEKASMAALVNTLKVLSLQLNRPEGEEPWELKEREPRIKKGCFAPQREGKRIRLYQDPDNQKYAGKPCWPFRPIVFGGDDVTFVCDGRLGLSLAAIFMREFALETKDAIGTTIHTGAGVCIVKVHYPFRRAHEMSARLTGAAKGLLDDPRKQSGLDWHIASAGLGGDLHSIQDREYRVKEGSLRMRPLWLAGGSGWRTWQNFNRLVALFNYHKDFAGRRNKLKALREALRQDKEAVKEFLKTYKVNLPILIGASSTFHEEGWDGERCGYFDALEAMDHHFLLEEVDCEDTD